ncbi:MAG: Mov34/MPN/PAD-1 family protein [Promethearchaeia archaeon]
MTVIIPNKVYKTIIAASMRFANQKMPKDDWLEVSGIFIGKNEDEDIRISQAYPIMHQEYEEDAIIDKYKWDDQDMIITSELETKAYEKGEFIVGWWHSHPGFKVMMSHIDIRTTLSYQQNNPLAISLVFNPERLVRQVELPSSKGDPEKQLENDPGFKIFRLDDVNRGIEASYHPIDYVILGYDNREQAVTQAQKFVIEVTNFFPKENIFRTYSDFVDKRINELNSKLVGTEQYLKTLKRKGEGKRIPEVLKSQKKEIQKYVAETYIKIENIKEFMDYLEYKERQTVIPKVKEILSEWDETVTDLNNRLQKLEKIK